MKKSCVLAIVVCIALMFSTTLWATYPVAKPVAQTQTPVLKPADINIQKSAVAAAIERAIGPIRLDCPGAKMALTAYNACKDRCAASAQNAPITAADLLSCGNMTASDCANMLVNQRAQACVKAAGVGCADEYAKLQKENTECKGCNDLKNQAQNALNAVQAQAKAVAQAEANLAQARAKMHSLQVQASALANKRNAVCAAAAR